MAQRRRGSGEGNIYKRSDGRWAARLSLGYKNGRRARRWLYGKTRAEVAAKLREGIQANQDGVLEVDGRLTVGAFLATWLVDSAAPKLRPRTLASYEQVVRSHVLPHLGRVPLRKLTPQRVQAWLNGLHQAGLSARTCQYARAILRSALSQAVRWGYLGRNAAALVDPPRVVKKEIQPLDPAQARALIAASREHRLRALVTVALSLGLRQGEALGLPWDAVDLEGGSLRVRQSLQRVNKAWHFVEPKSERSKRTLALPGIAVAALRAHRTRQLKERLLAGARWQDTGLVFTTTIGTPIEPSNLTKEFRRLLALAGIPKVRFHDLRHTAATLLLAQGVDARTIMETLGHSQVSLTLNTYSHVLPVLQREAAARMHAALEG